MEHCNHQACLNNMPKCRLSFAKINQFGCNKNVFVHFYSRKAYYLS